MTGAALRAARRPQPARVDRWRGRTLAVAPLGIGDPLGHEVGHQVGHPLGDDAVTTGLRRRADEIEAAFAAIEPALRSLAPHQFDPGFVPRANAELADRVGLALPAEALEATWLAPLDMRALYARLVLGTFCRLVERAFDRGLARLSDGESAQALIHRWGFHAVDITPCADGRLSGVVDYILRVPPAVVVSRQSYAGALFDVEETLRRWETVELRRWREGRPNPADEPTRFLKIGVYHFSSADPDHEGCAAHGSDTLRAASAVLERLEQLEAAVAQTHCCGAAVATLLVGVDTDTDATRVHVPDAAGRMDPGRFVDNRALYESTRDMPREAAKDAIRDAVAACAGVTANDLATEGMRWFCGYLLKNNIGQVDAVRAWHGDSYADLGHTERLIVVGDAVDDVQLRNLAFQAQMSTVEEGASDLDVGLRILCDLHEKRGLAVPVLVHFRYDPRIPGAAERARLRAQRLRAAIVSRYSNLARRGLLHVEAVVRAGDGASLAAVDLPTAASPESDV
jgi:carboxysome shell carbonic anhydrase